MNTSRKGYPEDADGWVGVGLGLGKGGHSPFYILQLPINRPMAALLVVVVVVVVVVSVVVSS